MRVKGLGKNYIPYSRTIDVVPEMPSRFPTGKVPPESLRKIVLSRLGVLSNRVLKGPSLGEDGAVLDMGDKVLVVATDPITGAVGNAGWLVVNINANDVASCGARPLWFLCVTMLPEGAGDAMLEEIMEQMHEACCNLNISLVGGHTETTPGLDRPILVGFMMGEALKENYVTTGGALPGDSIIMTKEAGIEGTAVIAQDLGSMLVERVGEDVVIRARQMIERISVVTEAMAAVERGGVHSFHDPTEGGILNGIWEMAEAAEVGVRISESAIPVNQETRLICDALEINPFKLLGSGSLLIASEKEKTAEIISAIKEIGVSAKVIGEVRPVHEGRFLLKDDHSMVPLDAVKQDHVYKILEKFGFDVS